MNADILLKKELHTTTTEFVQQNHHCIQIEYAFNSQLVIKQLTFRLT